MSLKAEIINEMIHQAFKVKEYAYSPYSNFSVGASILFEDNKIYSGCNVENVSFGATNCAERTAIFKAVSEGYRTIEAVCVVGPYEKFLYPCGICRQVIVEFAKDDSIPIIVAKNKEEYKVYSLKEISPFSFSKKDLI